MTAKVLKLRLIKNPERQLGARRVLVGGCFDVFHIGHSRFLKEAKHYGKSLVIALEGDEFIRRAKKREPLHSQKQRAEILASIEVVDVVLLLPYLTTFTDYLNLVRRVRPEVIVVEDKDNKINEKKKQARITGAKVITIDHHKTPPSSTLLKSLGKKGIEKKYAPARIPKENSLF